MTRLNVTALLMAASVAAMSGQGKPAVVEPPALAGSWALDRALSQFPREVGFGMDVVPSSRSGSGDSAGAEGGFTSGNPKSLTAKPQTQEVARNTQQLVDEVRNPPVRLTIAQTAAAVTMTDDRGRARTFHADGREELQALDAGPVTTTARVEGARLVVRYKIEPGRELRYSYSRKADPPQLVVQAEFLEHGGRDTVVRTYEPATAVEPASPEHAAPPAMPTVPMLPSQREAARQAPPGGADSGRGLVPAVPDRGATGQFDQRPDAELKGLATLGVVVEGLGSQAASCGLRQEAIEAAVSKSLSDAGLKVVRDADDDTYLYVNVITTAMSTGYCFSRYDAYIYSNTTATMSYGSRPALVQVSLMHKGGLTGSAPGSHGETVVRTITQYVDQFAAKIRQANK